MVMNTDLTWSGEHTREYTDDALQNCTLEIYVTLLTKPNKFNIFLKNK